MPDWTSPTERKTEHFSCFTFTYVLDVDFVFSGRQIEPEFLVKLPEAQVPLVYGLAAESNWDVRSKPLTGAVAVGVR
jgi:hypothetical protein